MEHLCKIFLFATFLVGSYGNPLAMDMEDPVPYAPWQASLRSYGDMTHFCSGAIISSRWILTTANCVNGRTISNTKIVVEKQTIKPAGPMYDIAEFFLNPDFDPIFYENNLALIRMETDIVFNGDVYAVDLPSSDPPAGELVVLTGWRSDEEIFTPNDMQMARKETLSNEQCAEIHRNGDSHVHIYPTSVCARPRMMNCYCIVDAGAPLVSEDGRLIGLFSITAGCGRMLPAVYMRVNSYRDWIRTVSGV
ncbi:trypsin-7-like [Uranotaenia lowii]|uniref:trypsin-7-like n=1 Tax=Uranotaenia lowii TaxID=190385 RepID=UPI00247A93E6|nr:trypsin-7-like [Uranotaenia lowii]